MRTFYISIISMLILFTSCIREEEITITKPDEVTAFMSIDKSFGDSIAQKIIVSLKNLNNEFTDFPNGQIFLNGMPLAFNMGINAYELQTLFSIGSETNYSFEIRFPDNITAVSTITTPIEFANVKIPSIIQIGEDVDILWDAGDIDQKMLLKIWIRPNHNEQWTSMLSTEISDDGSYTIPSTFFNATMDYWQLAIELGRETYGTADINLREGSSIRSVFVYDKFDIRLEL